MIRAMLRAERIGELGDVRLEVAARTEETTANLEEVAEVNRSLLVIVKLRRKNGQHRPTDDARLDERAGVQADDRGAVVQRVEVVGAALPVDRIAAPHRHRAQITEI